MLARIELIVFSGKEIARAVNLPRTAHLMADVALQLLLLSQLLLKRTLALQGWIWLLQELLVCGVIVHLLSFSDERVRRTVIPLPLQI